MKKIIKLFFIFFKIGAFTIGGGYAMIPVIHKELVEKEKLISNEEFLDIIAVAQTIPGIIAVNVSTFIGYQLFGFLGALFIAIAVILPSFVIIVLLANVLMIYKDSPYLIKIFKGIRPGIIGLMIYTVFKFKKLLKKNFLSRFLLVLTLFLCIILNIKPMIALGLSAIIGIIYGKKVNYEHLDETIN